MEEKQVVVKNVTTHYRILGEGKPILILHGWRSSSERWKVAAQAIADQRLKVIVPDLPGFGKSDEPKEAWGIDGYVEWAKEFADAIPELQQEFYLLGHSFGGAVAAKFCIKYAQRVKKLFLVAGSCIRITTPSKKVSYNISRLFKIFYVFPGYELFRKAMYKFVIRKSDYPHASGIMKSVYLKVIGEDLSQKLAFIRVPTAIIWGDKDDLTPLEHAHIIHKKIEGSTLTVFPGIGHAIQIYAPEMLAKEIIKDLL